MTSIIIVSAVVILIILLFPTKKKNKKCGNGTTEWSNTIFMRVVQVFDGIYRKIRKLIGG